jgi:hypothetical protein
MISISLLQSSPASRPIAHDRALRNSSGNGQTKTAGALGGQLGFGDKRIVAGNPHQTRQERASFGLRHS